MRIVTLGTSHGDATYCRFNTSTLYEIGEKKYLIDCGEPADALLVRRGLRSRDLSAVFLTHLHADHAGGLDTMLKAMRKCLQRETCPTDRPVIFLPEEGAADILNQWLVMMCAQGNAEDIDFRVTKPGAVWDDGNLSVSAVPTRHMSWSTGKDKHSYGYILRAEGKTILHTGDLRGDFTDFPAGDGYYDVCLCEATHYNVEKNLPILQNAHFGRLIFIHIGDGWHGEGEQKLLDATACLPYPVAVAHDGDEFVI